MTEALTITGLRKTFAATDEDMIPVRALRGVDLSVQRGEFVAVMGPSGCGKSTLLNLIAGLETPTDGRIHIDGEDVTGLSQDRLAVIRRRHIGIVFQFFNLLEGMTVRENVTLPMVVAGQSRKQAESRAMDLLDLLGIADKAAKEPGVLSGGQRQRLSIARALANEPTLLLADEPTGSLDSTGGAEVLGLFRRLHAGGQTIVMVTHDDEVAATADRIVHMRDGRIDDGRWELGDATRSTRKAKKLPLRLSILFGVAAFATLVHTLVTSVRRRRRDLAILQTLGFRRRQVAVTIAWQALTLTAAALLIGAPLGLLVGRLGWSAFAAQLGVVSEPASSFTGLVTVVIATLVVAVVVSVGPAMMARRTRPAEVLRAE